MTAKPANPILDIPTAESAIAPPLLFPLFNTTPCLEHRTLKRINKPQPTKNHFSLSLSLSLSLSHTHTHTHTHKSEFVEQMGFKTKTGVKRSQKKSHEQIRKRRWGRAYLCMNVCMGKWSRCDVKAKIGS
jgi:hypothetical protein